MFNILAMNNISSRGTDLMSKERYNVVTSHDSPDGILVRSASLHDMQLPSSLLAISRAGAGVNNIPLKECAEQGIVVFNTPGANANAVKEMVIAGLLLSSRRIIPAVNWTNSLKGKGDKVTALVEKGKSNFAGPELYGKKIGVIGLGAIGVMVANSARHLGLDVYGYDPYLSVETAWGLSRAVHHTTDIDEIYEKCDYITIHVPLNDDTKQSLNKQTFEKMKDGVRIINFSRGGLVNNKDIVKALESGKVSAYVVDFPTDDILGVENIIAIPHLGASTPESEDNCAIMAVKELKGYLENGNIKNSVNYPSVYVPRTAKSRLCIHHRNIPNMLTHISGVISAAGVNIDTMMNKSKGEYAYTILDIQDEVTAEQEHKILDMDGVIRIRTIV